MLRLFNRTTPTRATQSNADSPLGRMISLWLAYAKAVNATAIVIGMPRQIPAPVGEQNEPEFKQRLAEGDDPRVLISDDGATRALMASSRLRSVAGWRSVPVWMEYAGQLCRLAGPANH